MSNLTIKCPHCGIEINLTDAVEAELRQSFEEETKNRIQSEFELEKKDLQNQLTEQKRQLAESQQNELDLRKRERELKNRQERINIELEESLDKERQVIASETRNLVEASFRFKLDEKEKKLADVTKELDEVRKKADQSSQQTQGEVAELNLEATLKRIFPYDLIEPVKKGVAGADILQKVCTANGQLCGIIIWESKNTKNWSDRWLSKLKEDQLTAKAELAVLVSVALPEDITNFANIDGIWVTGFSYVVGLATALHEHILQIGKVRTFMEGKDDKIELLYHYLSGPEFRQRIEMLVTTFISMKKDLEKEKMSIQALWTKREKGIEKVTMNIAGMYGDMQGIAGAALPTISQLELPESNEHLINDAP